MTINGSNFCLEAGVCRDVGMKLLVDEKRCTASCKYWIETDDSLDLKCVNQCPDGYFAKEGLCKS